IVTDISMPWMTGLQVMHSARAAGLRVPIIVMTALRDPTIPEQVASLLRRLSEMTRVCSSKMTRRSDRWYAGRDGTAIAPMLH
ncbi:MAG TPA: hypothetical protein VM513_17820, partial [Kofleriaceae bacterium]|nr:hypothetical protein [Kofleriaceae bacterium]